MNRALFLDRDGVINEDYGYVHKIEDFHFREGIFDVCRAAQMAMMKIIIVTNQAGIGRGYYNLADFLVLSDYMHSIFRSNHVTIDELLYCPFHPEYGLGQYRKESYDRKPNPGMLVKACVKHDINPRFSVMIGDRQSDKIAALNIGIPVFINALLPDWKNLAITSFQQ
jgi:D-glycero-D-manno-heptose 1,7-bisphosphate phosphatase